MCTIIWRGKSYSGRKFVLSVGFGVGFGKGFVALTAFFLGRHGALISNKRFRV